MKLKELLVEKMQIQSILTQGVKMNDIFNDEPGKLSIEKVGSENVYVTTFPQIKTASIKTKDRTGKNIYYLVAIGDPKTDKWDSLENVFGKGKEVTTSMIVNVIGKPQYFKLNSSLNSLKFTCINCGNSNQSFTPLCNNCGKNHYIKTNDIKCGNCGSEYDPSEAACPICGEVNPNK